MSEVKYVKNGKKAMLDTIANATALTGGYANSYAVSAGNQSYNDYLNNLNEIALDLYDSYSKFNLSLDANVKILKQFINYAVSYINNSSELSLSPLLSSVLKLLYNEDKETTEKFITNTKNANKYLK